MEYLILVGGLGPPLMVVLHNLPGRAVGLVGTVIAAILSLGLLGLASLAHHEYREQCYPIGCGVFTELGIAILTTSATLVGWAWLGCLKTPLLRCEHEDTERKVLRLGLGHVIALAPWFVNVSIFISALMRQ
ncbi:MAG: hypothetical protein AAGK00_19990 [Pseudomonadota bacterium]